jgi:4-hydroxy-L-threonine phosphate dehydrogenase PdxA
MSLICLTTGDSDGVGLEVALKALLEIGPQNKKNFVLYRSQFVKAPAFTKIDRRFSRKTFSSWSQASIFLHTNKLTKNLLIDIASTQEAPYWVEEAAQLALEKTFSSLVTGPLSKGLIKSCGLKDMGHTGILKRISGVQTVNMGFIGKHFNVVLATDHVPLSQVSKEYSRKALQCAFKNSLQLLKKNRSGSVKKIDLRGICVLGLNPHAGENGLLGKEEMLWVKNFCKKRGLTGPLSPDAAFLKSNWNKYSVYIAAYHDQGLIPFKLVHGQETGFHISLGLPFLRTSVDHGTANDIFGKNIANPASMKEAILYNLRHK